MLTDNSQKLELSMGVFFQNVCKAYGKFQAVKDLTIQIPKGSLHFLLGPSGCGKTTTLRLLAGLETTTSGKIFIDNLEVTHLPAAKRNIGMVFQNYALWPHMTVKKNISYVLDLQKLTEKEKIDRLEEALSITHLHAFQDRLPGQLSGGQQQRVALARALAIRPKLLLLDEPLCNLDTQLRLEMRENILRIHEKTKITTLYVTHDQKEALSMGTSITVMHEGSEIQTGSPRDLYLRPRTPFLANFIGETNLLPGKIIQKKDHTFSLETEIGHLTVSSTEEFQLHQKVNISIRPECIKLVEREKNLEPSSHQFTLQSGSSTYQGECEILQLYTHSRRKIKCLTFNTDTPTPKVGGSIECIVQNKDIVLLPETFAGETRS